jgi:hypothetical protein
MHKANPAYAFSSMTLRPNHDKATLPGALATFDAPFGDAARHSKKCQGSRANGQDAVPTGFETILVVEDNTELHTYSTKSPGVRLPSLRGDRALAALNILASRPEIELLFMDVVLPGSPDLSADKIRIASMSTSDPTG